MHIFSSRDLDQDTFFYPMFHEIMIPCSGAVSPMWSVFLRVREAGPCGWIERSDEEPRSLVKVAGGDYDDHKMMHGRGSGFAKVNPLESSRCIFFSEAWCFGKLEGGGGESWKSGQFFGVCLSFCKMKMGLNRVGHSLICRQHLSAQLLSWCSCGCRRRAGFTEEFVQSDWRPQMMALPMIPSWW